MLPNRFPDEGQAPEYNTVDATLWYFEAIRDYEEATGDEALLRDLFPVLQEIDWHVRGTRYQIHVDPADGLRYAGEPGTELTWMDAKVDDWIFTPPASASRWMRVHRGTTCCFLRPSSRYYWVSGQVAARRPRYLGILNRHITKHGVYLLSGRIREWQFAVHRLNGRVR